LGLIADEKRELISDQFSSVLMLILPPRMIVILTKKFGEK
jgi:hypothetical protein